MQRKKLRYLSPLRRLNMLSHFCKPFGATSVSAVFNLLVLLRGDIYSNLRDHNLAFEQSLFYFVEFGNLNTSNEAIPKSFCRAQAHA